MPGTLGIDTPPTPAPANPPGGSGVSPPPAAAAPPAIGAAAPYIPPAAPYTSGDVAPGTLLSSCNFFKYSGSRGLVPLVIPGALNVSGALNILEVPPPAPPAAPPTPLHRFCAQSPTPPIPPSEIALPNVP